jgi:hypothetical protein
MQHFYVFNDVLVLSVVVLLLKLPQNKGLFWLSVVFSLLKLPQNEGLFWLSVVFSKNDQNRLELLVYNNNSMVFIKVCGIIFSEKKFFFNFIYPKIYPNGTTKVLSH